MERSISLPGKGSNTRNGRVIGSAILQPSNGGLSVHGALLGSN